jgi:hypothetical protein
MNPCVLRRKSPKAELEQIPPKSPDFGDKDLLQHIDLARILFGEVISLAGKRAKEK